MFRSAFRPSGILFYSLILLISVLTITLIANLEVYTYHSREDRLAEYLSSVTFFIAALFFFLSIPYSLKEKSFSFPRWRTFVLALLGIGFFLVAGEEISWGQRIFGITTPEMLEEINDQGEFNFHNINKRFFDDLLDRATILFVFIGLLLLVLKNEKVLGISTPDIYMVCAFAITPFYHQYGVKTLDFYHLIYPFFILTIIYSLWKKNWECLGVILTASTVTLLLRLLHIQFHDHFHLYNNSANEYKEFMFALCCAFYSYIIYKNLKLPAV